MKPAVLSAAEAGLYRGHFDPNANQKQQAAYRAGMQLRNWLEREVSQR